MERREECAGAWQLSTTTNAVWPHMSSCGVRKGRGPRAAPRDWCLVQCDATNATTWSARLAPYYFVAVIAFGVHGACGLRTVALGRGAAPVVGARLVMLGAVLSTVVSILIFTGLVRA
jgi:hypothetical protein